MKNLIIFKRSHLPKNIFDEEHIANYLKCTAQQKYLKTRTNNIKVK